MSRPFNSTLTRSKPQSAGVAAAQQIAAQQMAQQGFGVGGTGLSSTSLSNTALRTSGLNGANTNTGLARTALQQQQNRPLSRTAPRRPAPRGSAAPADGGAIDLSSFGTTSNTHFGHHSTLAAEDTTAPAALENEYIVNLQQQVYFLELELNLMKKAGGGGGSTNPTGLRGSGAPSAGEATSDAPDAPLDDVMVSLREKYVRMEAEYKKEQGELRAEAADLRSRARMRELELQNLKALHATLSQEAARWKGTASEYQSTLLDHQLANEQMILKLTARLGKREAKLEKVLEELVHLRAEHKVTLETYATERESYTAKWNERERKMDELNEQYLREKEQNLEWAERFRQSGEAALLAQLQEQQNAQLSVETALKRAELQRDQAEKNKASALESLERSMAENEELRTAMATLEADRRAREAKEERDRVSKVFWSSEVSSMQQQITQLTAKLAKLQEKYNDAKGLKKQLKEELIKSRVYLDELQARLAEEQATHSTTRAEEESLAEQARELKRDLQLKTEELTQLMARFKEVRAEGEQARLERDAATVQLSELQAKASVSDALQQLKLHEFVSMAHSNLKVAGAIENLMGKMKAGKDDVKEARREERRDRRAAEDLYSDDASQLSSVTPRTGLDSRPATQESDVTRSTDSRPFTAASTAESSFDGV
jgi:hypothetical protein